jgi:hypothetical protein
MQSSAAIVHHVSPALLLDDSAGKRLPESSGGQIRIG